MALRTHGSWDIWHVRQMAFRSFFGTYPTACGTNGIYQMASGTSGTFGMRVACFPLTHSFHNHNAGTQRNPHAPGRQALQYSSPLHSRLCTHYLIITTKLRSPCHRDWGRAHGRRLTRRTPCADENTAVHGNPLECTGITKGITKDNGRRFRRMHVVLLFL